MSSSDVSGEATGQAGRALGVDMSLEVVTLPVADVDRAKAFYQSLGWRLDIDLVVSDEVRTVQFTPPHSGCSIQFGKGRTAAEPGSSQAMILVVNDIDSARCDLTNRGVDISEVQEMKPPGFDTPRTLVLRPRVPQRPGWQRLGAARDHQPGRPAGPGRTDMDIAASADLLHETSQRHGSFEAVASTAPLVGLVCGLHGCPREREYPGRSLSRRRALHGGGQARRGDSMSTIRGWPFRP